MNAEIKPNYKIYKLETSKNRIQLKKTIELFRADNDEEAYKHLKDFCSSKNDKETYYYGKLFYHHIIHDDGTTSEICSDDMFESFTEKDKNNSFFKNLLEDISLWFEIHIVDKLSEFKYWLRDVFYFIKHKQYYRASWSLDTYLIDTIEHNIKILIKTKHGCSQPFLDRARLRLHANDKDFNLEAYNKEHFDYTPEEMKIATEETEKEYNNVLKYIRLYRYYSDSGYSFIDTNNKEEVEIDKNYRNTLPIKEGTYDDITDYQKVYKMAQENWNKIWDWFKEYGQTCWD